MLNEIKCPHCSKKIVENISIECLEERTFETKKAAKKYILEHIIIKIVTHDDGSRDLNI